MTTVIFPGGWMSAVHEGRLVPEAADIIQPDVSLAWTKEGTRFGHLSCSAVNDSAHHLCISEVPLIITHCSPLAIIHNLHSARASVSAIDKPYRWNI